MKTHILLLPPILLFLVIHVLVAAVPGTAEWPSQPLFVNMPYALFLVAMLMGMLFAQTRVVLIAVFCGIMTFLVDRHCFVTGDTAKGAAVVFFAVGYLPALGVLFYRQHECRVFSRKGGARGLVVLCAAASLALIPGLESFSTVAGVAENALFAPLSPVIHLPVASAVVAIVTLPFFFVKKEHESPVLGPTLFIALLLILAGLNFQSLLWESVSPRIVLLMFTAGGAFVLIWSVLEGTWRNANIDELTRLPGRRPMTRHFERLGAQYAIAIVDIDHFKRFNDKFGHKTGDHVLRYVASCIARNKAGTAYRYGGEEFVIVCEGGDYDGIVESLENLREMIGGREFKLRGQGRPRGKQSEATTKEMRGGSSKSHGSLVSTKVTVSIGVARLGGRYGSSQDVLSAADRALYRAKKDGRNKVKTTR